MTSENRCVWAPKTLHYAKFWAQNATKTSAGNIPESLSNLFLHDNCHLLQRLLNNAKFEHRFDGDVGFQFKFRFLKNNHFGCSFASWKRF